VSTRRVLQILASEPGQPEAPDVREAGLEFLDRSDTLTLIREVIVEERLLRAIRAQISREAVERAGVDMATRHRVASIFPVAADARNAQRTRARAMVAIAAAGILAVGFVSNWISVRHLLRSAIDTPRRSLTYHTAATMAGQLDTLDLPDGSRVILAPNSTVSYAMGPRHGPRDVRLDGEAYFDVVHDEARKFRVETRHALVTDIGTSFVVREYTADGQARVAVRSGAASLQARNSVSARPVRMARGEGAFIDRLGQISRFSGDPESYAAWTGGSLVFDATPLPEVLDRLGHWYDVEFRMVDTTLSDQYFTGEFRSASLADALAILGPLVHARFAQEGRAVVVTAISAGR